jgi:acetylornithine deacetylase/succinyl-diaminopimelate desuccinylase-like protein
MNERARDLDAFVDAGRLVDDLTRLIETPSVTGEEGLVRAWIAGRLTDIGAAVPVVDADPTEIAADPEWPGSAVGPRDLPIVVRRLGRGGGERNPTGRRRHGRSGADR